jgi:hypothetical protein
LASIDEELRSRECPDNPDLADHYRDFERDSFQWLISSHPAAQTLQQDVIDILRTLHCADAQRQRETLLTTSGGYEFFVDQGTANAVFGLRLGNDLLFLPEIPVPISLGWRLLWKRIYFLIQ